MKVYKSKAGYFYKELNNGKKTRISKEKYSKLLKKVNKKKSVKTQKRISTGGGKCIPMTPDEKQRRLRLGLPLEASDDVCAIAERLERHDEEEEERRRKAEEFELEQHKAQHKAKLEERKGKARERRRKAEEEEEAAAAVRAPAEQLKAQYKKMQREAEEMQREAKNTQMKKYSWKFYIYEYKVSDSRFDEGFEGRNGLNRLIPDDVEFTCESALQIPVPTNRFNKYYKRAPFKSNDLAAYQIFYKSKANSDNSDKVTAETFGKLLYRCRSFKHEPIRFTEEDEDGYILKLDVKLNNRVAIFGDIHGSFHTFYRSMLRLQEKRIITKVSDHKGYKVEPNCKILFLGDIVDRGQHSLEILYFILVLIDNSDLDSVIYNRGNHEERLVGMRDGLMREIVRKFSSDEKNMFVWNHVQQFFRSCPSAVILQLLNESMVCEQKIWCCHGSILGEKWSPVLNNSNNSNNMTVDYELDEVSTQLNDPKIPWFRINRISAECLRWADISVDPNAMSGYVTCGTRGSPTQPLQSMAYVDAALNKLGITCVIRGHQDSFSNTVLASNYTKPNLLPDTEWKTPGVSIQQILVEENCKDTTPFETLGYIKCEKGSERNTGKLCIPDESSPGKYKSVSQTTIGDIKAITISTNQDLGRYLGRDSFLILEHTSD